MLGLSFFTMAECSSCKRGWSLDQTIIQTFSVDRLKLNDLTKCPACGNEFSYLEGIIQNLISDSEVLDWSFTSDIMLTGQSELVVGRSHTIELEHEVPIINKIYFTCYEGFADVTPVIQGNKSFRIISSAMDRGVPLGGNLKVGWCLYGRSQWGHIQVWRRLLVQAKEELIHKQYNLALLTSEIAFESFIDTQIDKLLTRNGISNEASSVILESMTSIYHKVHKLLMHLDGINFKESGQINRKWQTVVEQRNKIAHGEVSEIPPEDAKMAFETVIRGIFYIIMRSSI